MIEKRGFLFASEALAQLMEEIGCCHAHVTAALALVEKIDAADGWPTPVRDGQEMPEGLRETADRSMREGLAAMNEGLQVIGMFTLALADGQPTAETRRELSGMGDTERAERTLDAEMSDHAHGFAAEYSAQLDDPNAPAGDPTPPEGWNLPAEEEGPHPSA